MQQFELVLGMNFVEMVENSGGRSRLRGIAYDARILFVYQYRLYFRILAALADLQTGTLLVTITNNKYILFIVITK